MSTSPDAARLTRAEARPVAWPSHGGAASRPPVSARSWLTTLEAAAPPPRAAHREPDPAEQAYRTGFAEGQQAAMSVVDARNQEQLERLHASLAELSGLRARVLRQAERDLVRLALALASRVAHREIRQDPAQLMSIARDALARLGEQVVATVRLHPDDHDAVQSAGQLDALPAGVVVNADPQVPAGGCVIESASGRADTGVEAQIAEIASRLLVPGAGQGS